MVVRNLHGRVIVHLLLPNRGAHLAIVRVAEEVSPQ
jgi:hypothetical protein